jgi:hypothetical protein
MNKFCIVSNQWSIGIGLRRCTIMGNWRWVLWVNWGYRTTSWSWSKNPIVYR